MYVIANKNLPVKVLDSLTQLAEVLLFSSENITYKEISGHPDVFFCQTEGQLIAAPNTPPAFLKLLESKAIPYQIGISQVTKQKYGAMPFNAVVTSQYLFHNTNYTDPLIIEQCKHKIIINLKQGFTRCSLAAPNDHLMITSDAGISKVLTQSNILHFLVNPERILLPGFSYGFFGGCCGFYQNHLVCTGTLNRLSNGEQLRNFIADHNFELTELNDDFLYDGGSLFFISKGE